MAALFLALMVLSGAALFIQADATVPDVYDAEEIYTIADDSVFYLRALRSDDSLRAVGTGFVIGADGTAATAYHVIRDAEKLEAIFPDGRVVQQIEVIGFSEETDAALLKLPQRKVRRTGSAIATYVDYTALPLREVDARYGEKVFAIGYPLKDTPIITEGIINSPRAEINGRDRVLVSAQVASGMSGGPVLDKQGQLIGVISGSLRTINNIHLVIDVDDLKALMPATP